MPGLCDSRPSHTVSILQIILRCPTPQKIPSQTVTVYAVEAQILQKKLDVKQRLVISLDVENITFAALWRLSGA